MSNVHATHVIEELGSMTPYKPALSKSTKGADIEGRQQFFQTEK
jgi:hypothetical protein